MNLLVLGGGNCQVNLIKKAKSLGTTVIVSDYYEDAPGKSYCDIPSMASSFDVDENLKIAKKYNIDAIATAGTDQPVYTAAKIAHALNIPFALTEKQAKNVTNKKNMKNIFLKNNIPTNKFAIIGEFFKKDQVSHLKPPFVIKPLDSQGQRGVLKVDTIEEIKNQFQNVVRFSRTNEILVEEYYKSEEITISGWVYNGQTHILTVTDRVTYNNYPHIGICTAHNFPSKYLNNYEKDILTISNKIVESFNIMNGPIYFQMLIGQEGIKVNEIACRLGGAYEDIFIPHLTGIDILQLLIDTSFGKLINTVPLEKYSLKDSKKFLSVQLLFSNPGKVSYITNNDIINKLPGVVSCDFSISTNSIIPTITNATQRIGYVIISGSSAENLSYNIDTVFNTIKVMDENENNLILNFNNYSKNYYK